MTSIRIIRDYSKGFGLIEILIMVGIMALLFTLAAGYTRRGSQQILLYREQAQLISEIARAKNLTLQRLQAEGEKVCGYGIAILSDSEYALFKNNCGDFSYSGESEIFEKITLEQTVKITEPTTVRDILFLPPEPKVYFDGRKSSGEVFITLGLPENISARLTINSSGQIATQ